jgi:microcystin-dependent protein
VANNLPGGRAYYTGKNAYASQAFELDTRRLLQDLGDQTLQMQAAISAAITGAATTPFLCPTGSILQYGGSSAPTGWVFCDGTSYARTGAMAALFAVIGTAFGAVDGTHFTVPDLRGRVAVGVGTGSGLTARTLAATGGEETHVLVTGELASHTHAVGTLANSSESAHTHGIGSYVAANESAHTHAAGTLATGAESGHTHSAGSYTQQLGGVITTAAPAAGAGVIGESNNATITGTSGGSSGHTHTVTGTSAAGSAHTHTLSGTSGAGSSHTHTISGSTASAGSDTGHNTMQPFLVLNCIIKT